MPFPVLLPIAVVAALHVLASAPPAIESISGGLVPTVPPTAERVRLSGDGLTITTDSKRWQRSEGWTTVPGSGTFYDLSSDGATVVGTRSSTPYVWRFGGVSGPLPTAPTATAFRGRGTNRDGTVYFGQATFTGTAENAFVQWPPDSPPVLYAMPDPFRIGTLIVSDVSEYGNCVVGTMAQPPAPGRLTHAWIWRAGEGVSDLGAPPPHIESWARAVSEYGDIIAGVVITPGTGATVRWTPSGTQYIGNLQVDEPQILTDIVHAMSADGAAMVGVGGNPLDRRGWLWTRALGLVDLNTYLPSIGVDTTGFTLAECIGISDDYRTLVGKGRLNGTLCVWMATNLPRPPGTPCGPADLGGTGGVHDFDGLLDNNDFIAFIDYFFAGSPHADRGRAGGIPGVDHAFNNNDFVVFIDQFFSGCAP